MADRVDLELVEAKSPRAATKQDQAVTPFFFAGAGHAHGIPKTDMNPLLGINFAEIFEFAADAPGIRF